ncbi:larval cuticle protein A2B-like [Photinus pyralis]|uniref:larval cuticle protein A2B-like n=1 Tax=Photinus pyralis TaxID=7054 RepID=UPI0012673850|nr:larval cuticle protein A2B-like [Photinus pyralis]XP_031333418.1 larval cuticle protein A2B-like [Photinus pyralis]XP_031333419.1 larval cuticle protein A2B-like [Photinus pyralis]
MALKYIILAAFVAVANAGAIGYGLSAYAGAPAVTYAASPVHHAHVPAHYAHAPVHYAHDPAVAYSHAPAVGIAKVAAPVAYAAPIAKAVVAEEYDANPQYSYAYDIQDAVTGDSKNQHETRNGDVVSGSYSVVDPDGVKRTVEYTADPHNGFNAVVHREPLGVAVKGVAPVAKYAAAPVAYAAPVAKYYH